MNIWCQITVDDVDSVDFD